MESDIHYIYPMTIACSLFVSAISLGNCPQKLFSQIQICLTVIVNF